MARNKGGRPPYEPSDKDRQLVKHMAAYGAPEDEIAKVVGVAEKTLRKHFRDELDTAHTQANVRVAERLYQQCMDGNTTAMIFWLKTRAGWREKQEIDHRSGDGSMTPKSLTDFYGGTDGGQADS